MLLAINSMANAVERQEDWPYFSEVASFFLQWIGRLITQASRGDKTIQVSICAGANMV